MRTISCKQIVEKVAELCKDANYILSDDALCSLQTAMTQEISPVGRDIIKQLIENAEIARTEKVPMCQDTGVAVVFLEIGQEVAIEGGYLYEAINDGVKKGYIEGYLRKSMVNDPLLRKNTGDNSPAVIHTQIVPGDALKITVAPKGAGSENMSKIKMMAPSDGIDGIKGFVIETVKEASSNPCPPIIVGVGIGGNFELCAILAKKALLNPLGHSNPLPHIAKLENELFLEINKLGIGPQGLGGSITTLGVHIEVYPCHIASLPVAVNINCHASRHRGIIL
jgi:fumarate hydratase subunit alpha